MKNVILSRYCVQNSVCEMGLSEEKDLLGSAPEIGIGKYYWHTSNLSHKCNNQEICNHS
jgi:hypothetical protein